MTIFHTPATSRTEATRHENHMGGGAWNVGDPIKALRIQATSCFFGEPRYYNEDKRPRTEAPAVAMERAIDSALDHDPVATLALAGELRGEWNIRTTPQVILVRAAHHAKVRGTGILALYAKDVLRRADEPSVCLAYHTWRYPGKMLPNSLKKALARFLETQSEYNLAKYRMESRGSKTVDVVNLTHPRSTPALAALVKGTLRNEATWEAIRSGGGSWEDALDAMGHTALLRNLRNLIQKGDKALIPVMNAKLVAGAEKGKQLPFRYYSAYRAVKDCAPPSTLDAVEKSLGLSLGNVPHFAGRTMSLCDNSGSACKTTTSSMGEMKVSDIANLTGVITGMVSDEGYLGVFGDSLVVAPVRKMSSVFDQLRGAEEAGARVGQSTENGIWLFWDKAIREKEHWDNVFVYSDMQAGHGGLYGLQHGGVRPNGWNMGSRALYPYVDYLHERGAPYIDVQKLIAKYRATVNRNVNVYLVQVAGYRDTIVPEYHPRTYVLGGWGDGVLRFAHQMSVEFPAQ